MLQNALSLAVWSLRQLRLNKTLFNVFLVKIISMCNQMVTSEIREY